VSLLFELCIDHEGSHLENYLQIQCITNLRASVFRVHFTNILTSVLQRENKALMWSANYVASGFNTVEGEVSLGYFHHLCRVEGLNLCWQGLDTGLTSIQNSRTKASQL